MPLWQVDVLARRSLGRCLMKLQGRDEVISASLLSSVDLERDCDQVLSQDDAGG